MLLGPQDLYLIFSARTVEITRESRAGISVLKAKSSGTQDVRLLFLKRSVTTPPNRPIWTAMRHTARRGIHRPIACYRLSDALKLSSNGKLKILIQESYLFQVDTRERHSLLEGM
jgi:hypothetical protein